MEIKTELRIPAITEYQKLRNAAGWEAIGDETVRQGLNNTLFCVCAIKEGSVIGMGRVIGDGAIYFYLQDIIVLPKFQRKGVGKLLMTEIENYLKQHARQNAFVGLMAADGVIEFYRKFGYQPRPEKRAGMYKMIEY